MLGASDREFVCGVEVDDFWDGVKGGAVLSQHVLAVFILRELHVHETLAAPVRWKQEEQIENGRRQKKKREWDESEKGRVGGKRGMT